MDARLTSAAEPATVDCQQLAAENTALRAQLTALRESDRIYRALLEHAPILISTKDLHGTVTSANRHFAVLAGYDPLTFVGHNVFELFPRPIAEALWDNDRRALDENRPIQQDEEVYHRDGTLHTYTTVKFPLYDDAGAAIGTCAVSTDITDTKMAQADSMTDELTGLKNRRYFNMRFVEEQKRAHRDGRLLTLLLADVDRFKGYNDQYGHPRGDAVLVAVADAIRHTLNRPGDLGFRIGGDEFACLFATSHAEESVELANQIRAIVAAQLIPHSGNHPYDIVTLSIGLSFVSPDSSPTQSEMYELGDQALYRAKHQGRNRVAR